MIKYIFVLIFCSLFQLSYAQDENSLQLSFQGGMAIPTDNFGSSSEVSSSGFAVNGKSAGIRLNYPLLKGFHISGGYSFNVYQIDRVAFDNYNQKLIKKELQGANQIITRQFEYRSSLSNYRNNNFTLGVKLDIKLTDKIKLYILPGASYSYVKSPGIGYTVKDSLYEFGASQSEEITAKLNFSFSTGFDYHISDKLLGLLDISFLASDHRPEVFVSGTNLAGEVQTTRVKDKIDFKTINISIGVVILLPRDDDK